MKKYNWRQRFSSLIAVMLSVAVPCTNPLCAAETGAKPEELARPVLENFLKSPPVFIENQGQWGDETIRFALSSYGVNVGLTDEGPRFQLFERVPFSGETAQTVGDPFSGEANGRSVEGGSVGIQQPNRHDGKRRSAVTTRMKEFIIRFTGACRVTPVGDGISQQVFHYRWGEPERWRENVPSWETAVYRGLWEGIDLRLTAKPSGIKYEFIVAPGADWHQVRVRCDGIERLGVREDGALVLNLGVGWAPLVDGAPMIYQEVNGKRVNLAGRYVILDDHTYSFAFTGDCDPLRPLVIDPEIEWSTYVGGNDSDEAADVAVDGDGNVLVTGTTRSAGWVSGGMDSNLGGTNDVFVVKISGKGAHLWSTYLGGEKNDIAAGIALDSEGNVLVTGHTESDGWVSGGYNTSCGCGFSEIGTSGYPYGDGFVVKLSPSGKHLWSTYLGGNYNGHSGNGDDSGTGIAVDKAGNVLVSGSTGSSGWVSGGFDTSYNGLDGFVVKLSPNGAHLWSTYVGGDFMDYANCIAVDGAGNVLVGGLTYPVTSNWIKGGYDTSFNGGFGDGFVAKLSSDGAHLWSTYVGGTGIDSCDALALDTTDNVLVAGATASAGWVSGGFNTNFTDETRSFIAKISAAGQHLWSTYVAGRGTETARGIAADDTGNILVTGSDYTYSGPYFYDAFLTKLGPSGQLWWTTYFGSDKPDEPEAGVAVAVDRAGSIFVVGSTDSGSWVGGGYGTNYHGNGEAFVVKIRDPTVLGDTGSLQVTIEPGGGPAGARWWRVGGYSWHKSGDTELGIAVGNQIIEFKDVDLWNKPTNQTVSIAKDKLTTVSGVYVRQTGSLVVILSPQSSIDAGAAWRRAGTTAWLESGQTEVAIETGHVIIEFSDIANWIAPESQSVTIAEDQRTTATGTYERSPVELAWSTYAGGSLEDEASGIAVDGEGNVVVCGTTKSDGWTRNGFDRSYAGRDDAFVMKLSPTGTHLWSTYLGGTERDEASAVAVDGSGNIYVTGSTASESDDPTFDVSGIDIIDLDSFAVRLKQHSDEVSKYLWSRFSDETRALLLDVDYPSMDPPYFRSTLRTELYRIVIGESIYDQQRFANVELSPRIQELLKQTIRPDIQRLLNRLLLEAAYPMELAKSPSGWVSGGFCTYHHLGGDAFIAKLSPTGLHLWSTYVGGYSEDSGRAVVVDGEGNVLITGTTWSGGWAKGGFNTIYNGWGDAFVVKLSPAGAHLWSTYLGAQREDEGHGISVDTAGNVLVTGGTRSLNWIKGGFSVQYRGGVDGWDGFVAKLSSTGQHLWSSYLGWTNSNKGLGITADSVGNTLVTGTTDLWGWGLWWEDAFVTKLSPEGAHLWSTSIAGDFWRTEGRAIAVDGTGNVLVTGQTGNNGWVRGGFDATSDGTYDAFVVKFSPTGAPIWSTYLGGAADDWGNGIAVDAAGNILVGGGTTSQAWVAGGFDTTFNGGGNGGTDAFVAKIHRLPAQRTIKVNLVAQEATIFKLTFEAEGYIASQLSLESTASLATPIPWVTEHSVVITTIAEGRFEVQLQLRDGMRFFRVRTSP